MLFTAVTCSSPALTVGVNPRSGLLPERAWEISREQTRTSLKLPKDPKEFVAILGTELDAAYQRTLNGLRRDHPIVEVPEGPRWPSRRESRGSDRHVTTIPKTSRATRLDHDGRCATRPVGRDLLR